MTNFAAVWPDHQVDDLRRLWDEGKSCSQIAAIIGGGLTRNAVIGKAHRMKLPARVRSHAEAARMGGFANRSRLVGSGQVRAVRRARKRTAAFAAPIVELPPVPAPEAPTTPPVRFADLGKHCCHYIAGETSGPDTLMCGAPTVSRHLCAYHLALCWHPGRGPGAVKPQLPSMWTAVGYGKVAAIAADGDATQPTVAT